jgi:flagellar motor switch/type III secretory pathway protein FliN
MESTETALATKEAPEQAGEKSWGATVWLPCELTLDLAVPKFRVGDLLRLKPRDLVDTGWLQGRDIPLRVNGKVIAWAEFEVVGDKLSVRLTELA